MPIKRIIFIRPGETDWNRNRRQQGWVAIPLNEHGQQQAARLAHFVRNIGVGMLYSSDLRRAVETAEILGQHLNIHPLFDARLRERNVGVWQGLTLEEIQKWYADEYKRFRENLMGYQVPGGESRQQVLSRSKSAFQDMMARGNAETIGIVSHSIIIRLMLAELVPGCEADQFALSNISVTTITRDADMWKLVQVNDVSHLEGLETQSVTEPEEA